MEKNKEGESIMIFSIPKSLKLEHGELHAQLSRATKEKGKIGIAAKNVANVLHAHFVKEEVMYPAAILVGEFIKMKLND